MQKITKCTKIKCQQFELLSSRFQLVHLDIVDTFRLVKNLTGPYFSTYWYLLTCMDRITQWTKVYPLTEISTQSISIAFVNTWIFRCRATLHASQFKSELFSELSKIIGFHRLRMTSYHPQKWITWTGASHSKNCDYCQEEIMVIRSTYCPTWITPNEQNSWPFTSVTGVNA